MVMITKHVQFISLIFVLIVRYIVPMYYMTL